MSDKPILLLGPKVEDEEDEGIDGEWSNAWSDFLKTIANSKSKIITPSFSEIEKTNKTKNIVISNPTPTQNFNILKRFAAIVVDSFGKRKVAKIITKSSLEDWAKENNFVVERSFQIHKHINPQLEKTEVSE